jgi:hypothetical protein
MDHQMALVWSGTSTDAAGYASQEIERVGIWESPLIALTRLPAGRVKWLTKIECQRLLNLFGRPTGDAAEEGMSIEPDDDGSPGHSDRGALMPEAPFHPSLLRTILRTDVFDAAQGRIIARLKKSRPATEAVKAGLDPIGNDAYRDAIEVYRTIRDQLIREGWAALDRLARAGETAALHMIAVIGGATGRAALNELIAHTGVSEADGEQGLKRMAEHLRSVFNGEAPAERAMLELSDTVRAAAASVHRTGFRKEDERRAEFAEALVNGTPGLTRLIAGLDVILKHLDGSAIADKIAADRDLFAAAFNLLYRPGAHPSS